MASLDFDKAYIHDGTTLSSFFGQEPASIDPEPTREGTIQSYAGGRTRVIVGDAEPQSVTVIWNHVSLTDKEFLEGLKGDLILYRDGAGMMFYGCYFSVPSTINIRPVDTCTVTLSITEVTHDIEV